MSDWMQGFLTGVSAAWLVPPVLYILVLIAQALWQDVKDNAHIRYCFKPNQMGAADLRVSKEKSPDARFYTRGRWILAIGPRKHKGGPRWQLAKMRNKGD